MLSVLFSVYDPLGFIAPSILEPKLIVQECWKRNLISLIKDIKVPRFYGFNEHKGDIVELHILTDL